MSRVIVINGSPRKEKGYTGLLLKPFIEGMIEAGADVEVCCHSDVYSSSWRYAKHDQSALPDDRTEADLSKWADPRKASGNYIDSKAGVSGDRRLVGKGKSRYPVAHCPGNGG